MDFDGDDAPDVASLANGLVQLRSSSSGAKLYFANLTDAVETTQWEGTAFHALAFDAAQHQLQVAGLSVRICVLVWWERCWGGRRGGYVWVPWRGVWENFSVMNAKWCGLAEQRNLGSCACPKCCKMTWACIQQSGSGRRRFSRNITKVSTAH
jgi:hypothetical protein